MTLWEARFIVAGSGYFPTEMLMYDKCWPASVYDAYRIGLAQKNTVNSLEIELVQLCKKKEHADMWRPNYTKWELAGWTVSRSATREEDARG